MEDNIYDLRTGKNKPASKALVTAAAAKRIKKMIDGIVLTRKEERIVEALEELREGGGLGALGRLNVVLYEWICLRDTVVSTKGLMARTQRSRAYFGECLEELTSLYQDEETRPCDVARMLRNISQRQRRYWKGRRK